MCILTDIHLFRQFEVADSPVLSNIYVEVNCGGQSPCHHKKSYMDPKFDSFHYFRSRRCMLLFHAVRTTRHPTETIGHEEGSGVQNKK